MTSQIQDQIDVRSIRYAITAIDGGGLFDPRDHGVEPSPLSTACWRGYICTYRIEVDALLLSELEIGLPGDEHPTTRLLFGRPPSDDRGKAWHSGAASYDLDEPVNFTGRLLLGADSVDDVYLNMGFRPAWLYRNVHELTFAAGRVIADVDRSAAAAELRDRLGSLAARPGNGESTRAWVERTFSRTFDYSWPPPPPAQ